MYKYRDSYSSLNLYETSIGGMTMGTCKHKKKNTNKKTRVASMDHYKEKAQEKESWIKEFEQGPQPIPKCTCGQHTDPNRFLTEKQVTKHYLIDRKRYVKELNGNDPLQNYMETFTHVMRDVALEKLSMHTEHASMTHINNHFKKGMQFYKQYIKQEHYLTYGAEIEAKELRLGYEIYKEHIVRSLISSYINEKLRFHRENADFARKENEDSLDTPMNDTEGYIECMRKHFEQKDMELEMHTLSNAAQDLDLQIYKKLHYKHISHSEIEALGNQLQKSLDIIQQTISHNRQRDFETIQERYDKVKDDCSLEYKAKTLIDLELRRREIHGSTYMNASAFTVNSSMKQLTESIGMANLMGKLSTKELESLFEQFKALGI